MSEDRSKRASDCRSLRGFPARRNGDTAKDQVGDELGAVADERGEVSQVTAGHEDGRRIGKLGRDAADAFTYRAARPPKETAGDGSLRVLTYHRRRPALPANK